MGCLLRCWSPVSPKSPVPSWLESCESCLVTVPPGIELWGRKQLDENKTKVTAKNHRVSRRREDKQEGHSSRNRLKKQKQGELHGGTGNTEWACLGLDTEAFLRERPWATLRTCVHKMGKH